jgi:hypothetical protein
LAAPESIAQKVARLFDYLVGAGEKTRPDKTAESHGRLPTPNHLVEISTNPLRNRSCPPRSV